MLEISQMNAVSHDDMNSDNIGSHDGEESVLHYGTDSRSKGA
jgi:hypothetical protein